MKMEHIEMVWASIAQFQNTKLTFGDFLEHLGKSLESATVHEARIIGEAARELDFVIAKEPHKTDKVEGIINELRSKLLSQLKISAH
jgi:hypothetical protein